MFIREKTKKVLVGKVQIGNQKKVVIQSMTTTKTSDVKATVDQINQLVKNGCDLVRVAICDEYDAVALKEVTKRVKCPVIADIHFNHKLALLSIENGAKKIRINPGNIGTKDQLQEIALKAKKHKVAIRIGVNTGSLPKEIDNRTSVDQIIKLLNKYVKWFQSWKFDQLVISVKSSDPSLTEKLYTAASKEFNYPLHLGVTEAGSKDNAIIKTALGLGNILKNGIGDTIRISIAGSPLGEPMICKKLLRECGVKQNIPNVISCPTCARVQYDIDSLLAKVEKFVYENPKPLTVAIMGCVVNGPGEAQHADIGVFGGKSECVIYMKGKKVKSVKKSAVFNEFKKLWMKIKK